MKGGSHTSDGVVSSECFSDGPGLGSNALLLLSDPFVPGFSVRRKKSLNIIYAITLIMNI